MDGKSELREEWRVTLTHGTCHHSATDRTLRDSLPTPYITLIPTRIAGQANRGTTPPHVLTLCPSQTKNQTQ